MKIDEKDLLYVKTRQELRNWLTDNHKTAECCWVYVSKIPKPDTVLYLDMVEEALCFGWLGRIGKTTGGKAAQRLTPRTNKSNWSE